MQVRQLWGSEVLAEGTVFYQVFYKWDTLECGAAKQTQTT